MNPTPNQTLTTQSKTNQGLVTESRWQERLEIVKALVAPKASQAEFELLVHVAGRTGLDPLAGQICMVSRWDNDAGGLKGTPQIRIDGFRLIAERTGKYRGQTPTEWCGKDGVWRDIWTGDGQPFAARAGVYRSDCTVPIYAVARFGAYAGKKKDGTLTSMWQTKGAEMIAKCAEALALRKAFPQELSGMYAHEEMEQADNIYTPPQSAIPKRGHTITAPKAQTVEAEEVKEIEKVTAQEAKPEVKAAPAQPPVNQAALDAFTKHLEQCPDVAEVELAYDDFRDKNNKSPKTLIEAYNVKAKRLKKLKEVEQ